MLEYAETAKNRGLNLMQGPGYDQESTPGLVAAGATVVVFTTGRGTTIGNAIAPVIKLASNTPIFERMRNDLDLSAGGVIDGTETIDEVGSACLKRFAASPAATQAKAEDTQAPRVSVLGRANRLALDAQDSRRTGCRMNLNLVCNLVCHW